MRKAVVAAAVIVMILAFAGSGFSQEVPGGDALQAQEKAPKGAKRIKTTEPVKRLMGEVISVDIEARTLNVRSRRGDVLFDLSSARMRRNMRLEDLKPGDRIGVVFVERDGRKIAKAVGRPTVRTKRSRKSEDLEIPERPAPAPENR